MTTMLSSLEHQLIERWQRDLPLVPRPYAAMADAIDASEGEVLASLRRLIANGALARIGGTCRPNTAGASTLAAIEVPEWRIDEVAQIVGAEPGVNHSYLRENDLNLWFVATGPDRGDLTETLARIAARTGLEVLDLPLERPFNIDLGFSLTGPRHTLPGTDAADISVLRPEDSPLLQALTDGLDVSERPFAALADRLMSSEAEVLSRIEKLVGARIVTRLGLIVRHRALGWRSNAMVVWDLPEDRIAAAGAALCSHPGITLAYQRRTVPGRWPYALYCMIHARSRAEAMDVLTGARALPELADAPHQVLFSLRCFKQTGALVHRARSEAAA